MTSRELIIKYLRKQGVPEKHLDELVTKFIENADADAVAGGAAENDEVSLKQ